MPYRFTERTDLTHFSSGRVFYNLPGHPAFPVRLISEVFQRCMDLRAASGLTGAVRLYDPCCGGAYHLAVLAYFHWDAIREVVASDIDSQALSIAGRNLSLLTKAGLDARLRELAEMYVHFGKESHADALASATVLRGQLAANLASRPIPARLFAANALSAREVADGVGQEKADLVLTDIPYGRLSQWQELGVDRNPIWMLLEALAGVLADGGLVAVAATKGQKVAHERYRQVNRLKVGKREITILAQVK
jgi:hypothetical protein